MEPDKKHSVLLIEDDDEITDIMVEMMQRWGYQVVSALSLPAAQTKISNQKFSVVVLDIGLRKASGLKLVETIRRNHTSINHTTPIILHSGIIAPEVFAKYKNEIDDALVKPSPSNLLREKLAFWAEKKHFTQKGSALRDFLNRKAG